MSERKPAPEETLSWLFITGALAVGLLPVVALATLLLTIASLPIQESAGLALVFWGAWVVGAPGTALLSRRYVLSRPHLRRSVLVLIPIYLLVVVTNQIVLRVTLHSERTAAYQQSPPPWIQNTRMGRKIAHPPAALRNARAPYAARLLLDTLIFAIIAATGQAFHWSRLARQRELQAMSAEHELIKAQLAALQMQLNPHLLFNALNGLTTLIHTDKTAAERLIVNLSECLRFGLELAHEPQITLERELEFLNHYLAVEQARFADRLQVTRTIDDETLEAIVPTLILQPLVENAIKHSIEPSPEGGQLKITADRKSNQLHLTVTNQAAPTPSKPRHQGHGIGLENCRKRLQTLYPAEHQVTLDEHQPGHTTVTLSFPFERRPLATPSS